MGKPLNQQRRGKGSPSFRRPSHRFVSSAKMPIYKENIRGEVLGFVDDPSKQTLLMEILCEDRTKHYMLAPEGIKIGDMVYFGSGAEVKTGNILPISDLPEGTPIFNVELNPYDGGRLVRSSGTCAYIVGHGDGLTSIKMPSKAIKTLKDTCRAIIGIASGSGRQELPFLKAGKKWHAMKAKNMYWPHNRGVHMNAVDHPFGGKEHHKGKSSCTSRNASPGRKVGHIAARRTGRKTRAREVED